MDRITVFYSCELCGIKDGPVSVIARAPGTDIVGWVENQVIAAVAVDHRTRSPICQARKIKTIKIPYMGSGPVGEVTKQ